jgi:hypothetical protein
MHGLYVFKVELSSIRTNYLKSFIYELDKINVPIVQYALNVKSKRLIYVSIT